jgi:4-hydroxy-tetrahydrodipicolinate synthase
MWQGVIPAVTTKFTPDGSLDFAEMRRCYRLQIEAGCDGLIACGSLGEGPMLTHAERIDVLKLCKEASGKKPAILTVCEASTRDACALAEKAARAGADGLMVVPSPIYFTDRRETVAVLRAVASATHLPIMIYSNRIAYRVDVTTDMLEELADEPKLVAIKESCDDIRRTIEILNRLGNRYDVFTGVDNLAFEALTVGAVGWVAGVMAFPRETVVIHRLIKAERHAEALAIYRWFRPLLDLDVSTYLVQNLKLVEALVIGTNDRVRPPRLAHSGERRAQIEALVKQALATRPKLPEIA